MKKIFSIVFILFFSSLFGGEQQNINTTALYINKITKSISNQLKKNKKFDIKSTTIVFQPIVNMSDNRSRTIVTQKIDENLLYSMSLEGFQVLDRKSFHKLHNKEIFSETILIATFTKYKDGIVINARIIDRQTALILSVAQVNVPKKVIRDIQRVYKKDGWFNK